MAKRSPILGYNHNVKYRGIVFHVQTEDSGLGSPHLFTHLFHEGVIISTRKLVYDPGANEEAIKALMQAQHKAVMKDLMKGSFDDKIDQYLGGVEGLEPSASGSKAPASGRGERAPTEATPPPPEAVAAPAEPAAPVAVDVAPTEAVPQLETLPASDESVPIELTVPKPRTKTARRSGKTKPPPSSAPPPPEQTAAQKLSAELEAELTDESGRARAPRDTAIEMPHEVTITPRTRTGDQAARARPPTDRPASHGAAALPPVKAPSRPQMSPPPVMSRQPAGSDGKIQKPADDAESAPVEVYAPPLPSAEPPPGERANRVGTYSMSRARPPSDNVPLRDKTGRISAIPSNMIPQRPERPATPPPVRATPPSTPPSGMRAATSVGHGVRDSAPMRPGGPAKPVEHVRAPGKLETPASGVPGQVPPRVTAPMQSRATPASGNVVMTRPAVIVGAPAGKPPTAPPATAPKVRKAREDEGRGFGQGLISEKSLDEVILAYLSEDAEDK